MEQINILKIMEIAGNTEKIQDCSYDDMFGYISHLHSEVSEIFEEYRKGNLPSEIYCEKDGIEKGIPIELADVVIMSCTIAARYNIDLNSAIQRKLEFNKLRVRDCNHGIDIHRKQS